jgi:hypothetical protein
MFIKYSTVRNCFKFNETENVISLSKWDFIHMVGLLQKCHLPNSRRESTSTEIIKLQNAFLSLCQYFFMNLNFHLIAMTLIKGHRHKKSGYS